MPTGLVFDAVFKAVAGGFSGEVLKGRHRRLSIR